MLNNFLRCIVLYLVLLVAMRLMGKRQIGELQPFEFAITLVVADLACIPMQDNTMPILYGIIPIFTLLVFHILITKICVKSVRFRRVINGKPTVIISEGKLDVKALKKLDMNTNDVLEALRCAGYFKPGDVECAVVETNGTVAVLPKFANAPVTNADMGIEGGQNDLPVTAIVEGVFLKDNLKQNSVTITKEQICALLDNVGLRQKDVFLMSLSGENAFIQPYYGDPINRSIQESQNE